MHRNCILSIKYAFYILLFNKTRAKYKITTIKSWLKSKQWQQYDRNMSSVAKQIVANVIKQILTVILDAIQVSHVVITTKLWLIKTVLY